MKRGCQRGVDGVTTAVAAKPSASDATIRSTPSAAAVHIDRVRGHKFASIGANEQNQFADFLRFAEALHWYIVEELLNQLGRGLRRALKRRVVVIWRVDFVLELPEKSQLSTSPLDNYPAFHSNPEARCCAANVSARCSGLWCP